MHLYRILQNACLQNPEKMASLWRFVPKASIKDLVVGRAALALLGASADAAAADALDGAAVGRSAAASAAHPQHAQQKNRPRGILRGSRGTLLGLLSIPCRHWKAACHAPRAACPCCPARPCAPRGSAGGRDKRVTTRTRALSTALTLPSLYTGVVLDGPRHYSAYSLRRSYHGNRLLKE